MPPPPGADRSQLASKSRYYYDFVRLSIRAEFTRDAARNRLGYAWWVLEPTLMLAVFYLVFGLILERGGADFIYHLLVGVALWSWFSLSIQKATASIQQATGLMQQVYIPKHLLPLAAICGEAIKALILLAILLLILGATLGPGIAWLWLPPLFALQLLFAGGIGLITAHLLPFMNDVRFMVTLLLRLGMFLSGVFYHIDEAVPVEYRDWLMLNPLASLIAEARRVLVAGQAPQWNWLLYVLAVSATLLAVGALLIARYDKQYPRLVSR